MIVFNSQNADGAMNMAIDESMLWWMNLLQTDLQELVKVGSGSLSEFPFPLNECLLRFYGWDPPAVSLGRYQRSERYLSLDNVAKRGLDVVRRPTGGKALIHQNELTYCLVVPSSSLLCSRSVRESHKIIVRALVKALSEIGIKAELGYLSGSGENKAGKPCFKEHLAESVIVKGRKVAGSAQLRQKGAILQHGSILLSLDYELHNEVFGSNAADLNESAAGLYDLSFREFSINDLKRTIADALSEELCENVTDWCNIFPEFVKNYALGLRSDKYHLTVSALRRDCNG